MSYYSPIAPIDCLLKIRQSGFLGNYLVLLAHDVVANKEKYTELLSDFTGTLIMDNSLIELGEPVTIETMFEALDITGANYAVLPDKLLDKDATIEASTAALRQWEKIGLEAGHVIVAQGKTADECVECVTAIAEEIKPGDSFMVSIPRALVDVLGSRMPVIEALSKEDPYGEMPIHLLGFSSNYHDDIRCARHPNVLGIDSATPIRLAFEGKILPNSNDEIDPTDRLKREREVFFDTCKSCNSYTAYNVGAIRGAINVC